MELQERIRKYIHNYIVFLNTLREDNTIMRMLIVTELDEFYENIKGLENQESFTSEELKKILEISTYFSSISTDFFNGLFRNNSKISTKILEFMHQSIEIDQVLQMNV